jgi:hypothetical protein
MEYHNCVENLWLISAAANTGAGKGNQDPILWLKESPYFGEAFLSSIGGESSISSDQILYVTRDGQLLCAAAKAWAQEHHAEEKMTISYLRYKVTRPLLQNFGDIQQSKRARVKEMAALAMMHQLAVPAAASEPQKKRQKQADQPSQVSLAGSSSPGSSSIDSSEAEISEKNLERMEVVAEEKAKEQFDPAAEAKKLAKQYLAAAKKGNLSKK